MRVTQVVGTPTLVLPLPFDVHDQIHWSISSWRSRRRLIWENIVTININSYRLFSSRAWYPQIRNADNQWQKWKRPTKNKQQRTCATANPHSTYKNALSKHEKLVPHPRTFALNAKPMQIILKSRSFSNRNRLYAASRSTFPEICLNKV